MRPYPPCIGGGNGIWQAQGAVLVRLKPLSTLATFYEGAPFRGISRLLAL